MHSSLRRRAIFTLAAIAGLVPFAIDMYLPSLPEIGEEFAAPAWMTQITLSGYLLLLGAGQLIAGPVSDAFGRRKPLLIGMVLFTMGSGIAVLAPTMEVLIGARLLQGLGGAIGLVAANSSVRDHTSGDAATRLYAVLLTVAALAPVLAPAVGGVLGDSYGWRAVFVVLTILGGLITLAATLFLPESHPARLRQKAQVMAVWAEYGRLLRVPQFLVPMLGFAAMFMVLFSYIGGAAYVYQKDYNLSAGLFGFVFGATGLAVLVGAMLASHLAEKHGTPRLAIIGVITVSAGTAIATVVLALGGPLWAVVAGMVVVLGGVGASEPALMSICMSAVERSSGSAAAVLGSAQYILGAAGTALAGNIATGSAVGWGLMMVAISVLGTVAIILSARNLNTEVAVSH